MKKIVILMLVALAAACGPQEEPEVAEANEPTVTDEQQQQEQEIDAEAAAEAQELVVDATATLQEMQSEPELAATLDQAEGVFIVPQYGQGAAVVGVEGGEGVLLVNENGSWSGPAFYDLGGVSVGAQFGGEGGEIAMLLMSQRAVESFEEANNFSLTADAGLTIIDWSARAESNVGTGDVILWSDTEGAFAGADLAVRDINWDDEENAGYYGEPVTPEDVLSGSATGPAANPLQDALSSDPLGNN